MSAEPEGLAQFFYLDPEDEAEAVAALPLVPRRSFLRERLGVPGEVVQGLRQVRTEGIVWLYSMGESQGGIFVNQRGVCEFPPAVIECCRWCFFAPSRRCVCCTRSMNQPTGYFCRRCTASGGSWKTFWLFLSVVMSLS